MKLVGMLDSPYVRRVAISLQLLGLRFEHQSLSVFRTFTQFQQINPVVMAPTLILDGGKVLIDSTLILQYAEAVSDRRTLMPADRHELQQELRIIGLALAACEKSRQLIYERQLRPPEKLHEPWVARVTGQLLGAYAALEEEVAGRPLAAMSSTITQAGVSTAVAWCFTQQMLPDDVPAAEYPSLAGFSAQAEMLPEFKAAPYGEGTYRAGD